MIMFSYGIGQTELMVEWSQFSNEDLPTSYDSNEVQLEFVKHLVHLLVLETKIEVNLGTIIDIEDFPIKCKLLHVTSRVLKFVKLYLNYSMWWHQLYLLFR